MIGKSLSIVKDARPATAEDPTSRSGEQELVHEAVQGDAQAFGALYSVHLDAIYAYVYYRTGNVTVAEDLTEDVFLKAWRAIGSYQRQGLSFSSWLYRIARNVAIDYYRTTRQDLPLRSEPPTLAEEEELGPEELVLKREELKELQHAIWRLPEEQQRVIVLRFVEGLSHAQVAEILGKTEEACRVIQHRGLMALSTLLGEVK
jgi:RNA polymerase sigma-70 factor (ECF subfamily)